MKTELLLPEPDIFGNYWFREKAKAPAILSGDNGYMVSVHNGVVFDGSKIKWFKTPEDALAELSKRL